MRIIENTFAIFWSMPCKGKRQQFHADMAKLYPDEMPSMSVARFRTLFPADCVHSVRDRSGRFLPFKA